MANDTRLAAQADVLNGARMVIMDVRNAFIDLLAAKESLALANENLRALTEIVTLNSIKVKSGEMAEVELLRSRVAELQFQNQVRQAESRVRTARNRLQFLLGRPSCAGGRRTDPVAGIY